MYEDALEVHAKQDESMIFIPPASWNDMLSALSRAEYVQLKQNEQLFHGLQISKGLLPLHFEFTKGNNGGFTLHIAGLNRVRVWRCIITLFTMGNYIIYLWKIVCDLLNCKR